MKKEVKTKEPVGQPHPIIEKKIEKALKLSVKEGATYSLASGFGISYIAPFAIALKATAGQIGILNGMIHLLPTIAHLKVSKLLERISSKKIVLFGVMAQVFLFALMIVAGVGYYYGAPHMIWFLIIVAGLFYTFGAMIHSAWFFWMGLLVPERVRGKYFSKRNAIVGTFGLIAMISAAFFLDKMEAFGANGDVLYYTILAFGILFALAMFFRFLCWVMLKKSYEPPVKVRKKDYFSFADFIKKASLTPFGKFTIFRGFFSIAIGIGAPFFELYLLRNLGFSYIWFMAVIVSGTFFQLLFLPVLGKVSDRFGNIQLTRISAGLIFLVPGLWLLTAFIQNPLFLLLYLIFVPSIVSGFAWAGYNLATNNYIYDSVSPKKRCLGISYSNIVVGVCLFIGTGIGTLIAWRGVNFMDTILFIFLVSTIARFIVFVVGIKHLREVRPVKKFSSRYLIREFKSLNEITREVNYIGHLFDRPAELKKKNFHFY
jgi:MFS family permease